MANPYSVSRIYSARASKKTTDSGTASASCHALGDFAVARAERIVVRGESERAREVTLCRGRIVVHAKRVVGGFDQPGNPRGLGGARELDGFAHSREREGRPDAIPEPRSITPFQTQGLDPARGIGGHRARARDRLGKV